jgi:tetratricopeptide (TPR) repeat protein
MNTLDEAEHSYRQVVRVAPSASDSTLVARLYINLGSLQMMVPQRQEEAADAYSRALSVAPTHAFASFQLGSIYLRMAASSAAPRGHLVQATEHLRQVSAAESSMPPRLRSLTSC